MGCFLTANQWKNWTIYFSIYCLQDLLPPPQLECWRHLVLACRRICKFSVTEEDITIADGLLLRFCKRTVQLCGSEAITPNMHMHCHLASCIREFGPVHSFWLFPFKKYSSITWHGKKLISTLCKKAKYPFVFVVPPFPFEARVCTAFQRKETGRDRILPYCPTPKSLKHIFWHVLNGL